MAGFKLPFSAEVKPAVFELHRIQDDSGISGTGHVLDGVVFPDGTTVVRWRGKHRSTATFKNYRDFEKIHMAYHGSSEVKWTDGFNGVEFAYNYLQTLGSQILKLPKNNTNKYILSKIYQIIMNKVKQLEDLRNDEEITISQDRGRSQTSLSATGLDAKSLTSAQEDNDSTPKMEGSKIPPYRFPSNDEIVQRTAGLERQDIKTNT